MYARGVRQLHGLIPWICVGRDANAMHSLSAHYIARYIRVFYRGGPAALGELLSQRGSAGRKAVRSCCAAQPEQAGRSSRKARLPGQLSASGHASALWACKLLASDAGAAGRLRGTDLCFAGDASLNDF